MNLIQKISSRLLRLGKHLQRDLAGRAGLYHSFYRSARGSRIIVYHGICKKDPLRFNTLFVTEKTFEEHLKFYRKHFCIVSLADFYRGKFDPDRFTICLTFDDGFANNYKYVLPLLEKYKVPATFFVTAIRKEGYAILWNDFLTISTAIGSRELVFDHELFYKRKKHGYVSAATGTKLAETLRAYGFSEKQKMMELLELSSPFSKEAKGLEDYWLQMTVDELQLAAASPLITIGSHGFYHNDLAQIPVTDMRNELRGSKAFLEQVIQKPITQLAFPYGSYSEDTVTEALAAGYKQLLATEFLLPASHQNKAMRERMGVNPYISTYNQMYAIITGKYA